MTSIPLLISELVRVVLLPAVVGPVAISLLLIREVGPEWKVSFRRLVYDLLVVGLSIVTIILFLLKLAGSRAV